MTDRPILFSTSMVRALLAGRKTQTRRLLTPATARFDTMPSARIATEYWQRHASWLDVWPDGTADSGQYLHVPAHHVPECCRCRDMGWHGTTHRLYPVIEVGDRLWVRETWAVGACAEGLSPLMLSPRTWLGDNGGCWYAAGGHPASPISPRGKLRPGIHMPRWASRLTLTVTAVRVQRLQQIDQVDARAEGIEVWHQDEALASNRRASRWCAYSREVQRQRGGVTGVACDLGAYAMLWDQINGKRKGAAWDDNPWVIATTFDVAQRNIDTPSASAATMMEHV